MKLKKLPLGVQTFKDIIESGYLYIDKTKKLDELINSGKHFFISRPRRFGKSLLISMLEEIFSGNKELFKGLYIYDKIKWENYPVIRIDMSTIPRDSSQRLQEGLLAECNQIGNKYGIDLEKKYYDTAFRELIIKISEKTQKKVVVLIDEYDKPIIDAIKNRGLSFENREILKNYYTMIKASDEYLKFVLLTGVSKFSKVSVFSGLNNLTDMTMDGRFADIMGITQQELESFCNKHIDDLSGYMSISRQELLERIKTWYNGYSWDGKTRLYNPYSLLSLFSARSFGNFWFQSGTPTFLIETLKDKKALIEDFENKEVGGAAFESFDIDRIESTSLLFQTGYLSITGVNEDIRGNTYILNYPNFEVKDSLLNHLLAQFAGDETGDIKPLVNKLVELLNQNNLEAFLQQIKKLFAGIPSTLHLAKEAYYHSLFYMILSLMGAKIDLEVLTDNGRVDAVLELKDKVFIIEFKLGSADDALRQIEDRKYYERYVMPGKATCLLGVGGFLEKKIECRIKNSETSLKN